MSKKLSMLTTIMVMLCVGFVSCSGDEDTTVPPQSEQTKDDGNQQTENLSNKDPEGTVVINMNNGAKDNYYDLGFGSSYKIHIDEANNLIGESQYYSSPYGGSGYQIPLEIVTIGSVSGLSEVNTIPTTGWSTSAAVVPRTGYVVRVKGQSYSYDNHARLYVVDYTVGTSGGIIGATIKYQSPFARTIKLEKSSLTFTSGASSQTVNLVDPTAYEVSESPAWCTVSSSTNPIRITVNENLAKQQSGKIVLKNVSSTAVLEIVQQGSSSPLYESGHGIGGDPYQIMTAQQLQNVNLKPDLHYSLISDIDMSSYLSTTDNGWNPIGTSDKPFTGTFDGKNHTISGMWINKPIVSNVGLFGSTTKATIKNIVLKTSDKGIIGSINVGGICGRLSGHISDCTVDGVISGDDYVGGICGGDLPYLVSLDMWGYTSGYASSDISNCFSKGVIKSSGSNRGGILGGDYNSEYPCTITNCSSTATLQDK